MGKVDSLQATADIVIVGGGLTGSLLAILLARRGHRVEVFERQPDVRERQAGVRSALNITLCERGLCALANAGMRETILDLAVPARGRNVHSLDGTITYQPYGNHGEAIYSISRSDLNRALIERACSDSRIRFHFEAKLTKLDLQGNVASFVAPGGETLVVAAKRFFGTDGAHSAVRTQLQRREQFNFSQEYWRQGGYKSLRLAARGDGTPALADEALHIWPRGDRMLMGFPNRDGSAMLSLLLPFKGAHSFEALADEASLLRFFHGQFPDVASDIVGLSEQFFARPPNPLLTVRCDPWHYEDKVLLLGDAAHALLPSYGQGANAGFEDCAILDQCLDEHGENWGIAFRAFEAMRRPALDVMADLCIEHFNELTTLVADPAFLKRRQIERSLNDLYPELYRPLYAMVSFTRIPYDEAFGIELSQRRAVDRIIALDDVESKLSTSLVRQLLVDSATEATTSHPQGVAPVEPSRKPDAESMLQFGLRFWEAKALLSAVELGVFASLSSGPLTRAELAAKAGLHPRGATDFLDALTALGLLDRSSDRYALTSAAREALTPGGASFVGGALDLANARLYPVWSKLSDALRSGEPQNEAQQSSDYYGNLTQHSDRLRTFLLAMSGLSRMAVKALVSKFAWQEYGSFADVGGAQGLLAIEVARRYPHLQGINFELPPVKPIFEECVLAAGLQDRLVFKSGDFFGDPLPNVDVIVMGHVLHNWSLTQKQTLIQKAYQALPVGGALIIYEALIDDARRENSFGLLMSLNMLLVTTEGFVFTGRDCQHWMRDAGFRRSYVEHLHGPDSMVVAIK